MPSRTKHSPGSGRGGGEVAGAGTGGCPKWAGAPTPWPEHQLWAVGTGGLRPHPTAPLPHRRGGLLARRGDFFVGFLCLSPDRGGRKTGRVKTSVRRECVGNGSHGNELWACAHALRCAIEEIARWASRLFMEPAESFACAAVLRPSIIRIARRVGRGGVDKGRGGVRGHRSRWMGRANASLLESI